MSAPISRPVLALLAATSVALPAAAPSIASAHSIKHGSRGSAVKQLQRDLHLSPVDGIFGAGTLRSVKHFQRVHHLHADGIVGAGTWAMIRRARKAHTSSGSTSSGGGSVRVATRGASVRLLQRHLGVSADGVFGPGTASAVKRYQRAHGLTADGIVGPGTWSALGVDGTHPVLKRAKLGGGSSGGGVPRHVALLRRAVAAGNRIARFPYVYGGGHGSFHASGYDCSGSVSYVLHAMGRLDTPEDSGQLMSYGKPGPGRFVTIYANAGHAFMVINGRRFDTSGRSGSGSRWQADDRSSAGYTVRHPPGL
jgi:peptidoglycan hydrolase-like protein with peptidoglycan-binding domain